MSWADMDMVDDPEEVAPAEAGDVKGSSPIPRDSYVVLLWLAKRGY